MTSIGRQSDSTKSANDGGKQVIEARSETDHFYLARYSDWPWLRQEQEVVGVADRYRIARAGAAPSIGYGCGYCGSYNLLVVAAALFSEEKCRFQ